MSGCTSNTRLGATVRSIEDMERNERPLQPLSREERELNRDVLGGYYARARVVASIRDLAES